MVPRGSSYDFHRQLNLKKTSNVFCVHIDAKSDDTYHLVKKYARCVKNVFVLENRVDITYAAYRKGLR